MVRLRLVAQAGNWRRFWRPTLAMPARPPATRLRPPLGVTVLPPFSQRRFQIGTCQNWPEVIAIRSAPEMVRLVLCKR